MVKPTTASAMRRFRLDADGGRRGLRFSHAMTVAVLGAGALAAACVQASTGLGFALVLTPIAFALFPAPAAIIVVTVLGVVLNVLVLAAEQRRPRVVWGEAIPILAAAIPGTAAGVVALAVLPKPVLQIAVGTGLLAITVTRLGSRAQEPRETRGTGRTRLALGLLTGMLGTSTGVTGPPLAIWLERRGLTPAELRDSLSAMFLVLGLLGCIALVPLFHRAHPQAAVLIGGVACVAGGHAVGRQVFARLSPQRFIPLVQVVVLAAGIASVAAGLSAAG
jgi:uncharacterized protein